MEYAATEGGELAMSFPNVEVPAMVRARTGDKGKTPIRHGERFVLGYEVGASVDRRYYVAPRGMGGSKKASSYPLDAAGWAAAWQEFSRREKSPKCWGSSPRQQ